MLLFSASQIKTKRQCVRKWALEKIAGLRGPETPSQALGKDVDDNQLQPYLRDGRPFDFTRDSGYIAASGLAWLPPPKWRGLEVQKKFIIPSPSSKSVGVEFGYLGFLDLWLPYGGQPGFDNELPVVGDFKTTKSIRKWALKEDALRKDVQAQLYSVWAILETKSKEINLSWLYLQTEGTRLAVPTQITVHTDEVAAQFAGIEKDAREMVRIRQAQPEGSDPQEYALSLPPNPDACDAFGGCPFRHICNLSPEDFFSSIDKPAAGNCAGSVQEKPMAEQIDLFAKLRKKADSPAVVETAPVPASPPTQAQIAAEPALGINPPMPEGTPLAPPVGSVEVKPKATRGRPKKTEAAPVSKEFDEAGFDAAWSTLGAAVKDFLKAVNA